MNPRLARALRAAVSADLIGNVKQCRRFWDAAALGNHLVNGGPQLKDGLIDRAGLGKSWRRRNGRRSLVSGDLCISQRGGGLHAVLVLSVNQNLRLVLMGCHR